MSPWPGKFVIGLTGNIAAGKSVVRRMLEHLGAYGIDADALAHRAMARGAPGYQPIVEYFGRWILDEEGQVDRGRVGQIAFSNPAALQRLEGILHPFVRQAIDVLVRRAGQRVIVIEAIKLLEGDLHKSCDSIWVAHASEAVRIQRLMDKRKLSAAEARLRVEAQGSADDKAAAAQVLIRNDGSFDKTWQLVSAAWNQQFQEVEAEPVRVVEQPGDLTIQRARPSQAMEIAHFITAITGGRRNMTRADVMAAFGEKAFLISLHEGRIVGLLGWQVENLVTRATDLYVDPDLPLAKVAAGLLEQMEAASGDLQSEAALLFLPRDQAASAEFWQGLGYELQAIEALNVRAWQEAAREAERGVSAEGPASDRQLFFKRLRADRVLRPI